MSRFWRHDTGTKLPVDDLNKNNFLFHCKSQNIMEKAKAIYAEH